MLYITGDTHGEVSRFIEQHTRYQLTEKDTLIVAGDFGCIFGLGWRDEHKLDMSDEEVKAWFLNNMNSANIPMYNNIDEAAHPRFFKVYRLLHSISHILIKQAASVCGLDKNSSAAKEEPV